MPGGFAPRFAIEAGFLILLGVGAGIANLRAAVIVALLAGGWALVSLIELATWHAQARPVRRPAPPEPQPEPEPEVGWPADEEPVEPEDSPYPLRTDAGSQPSDEVEAYTRVLGGHPQSAPPHETAE
jgi:hypothetical protein